MPADVYAIRAHNNVAFVQPRSNDAAFFLRQQLGLGLPQFRFFLLKSKVGDQIET